MTGPDIAENALDPMDSHLGRRIHARRSTLNLSPETVAQSLAVSVEALARIEAGTARITPSQLQTLAHVLAVPISFFFESMPREMEPSFPGTPLADLGELGGGEDSRETLALLRAFQSIADERDRRLIMDLTLRLALPTTE